MAQPNLIDTTNDVIAKLAQIRNRANTNDSTQHSMPSAESAIRTFHNWAPQNAPYRAAIAEQAPTVLLGDDPMNAFTGATSLEANEVWSDAKKEQQEIDYRTATQFAALNTEYHDEMAKQHSIRKKDDKKTKSELKRLAKQTKVSKNLTYGFLGLATAITIVTLMLTAPKLFKSNEVPDANAQQQIEETVNDKTNGKTQGASTGNFKLGEIIESLINDKNVKSVTVTSADNTGEKGK